MQRIIVPTDFSDAADNALKVAKAIAQKSNAIIHLANFYSIPMADYSYPEINMPGEILLDIEKAAKIEMDKLLIELKTEGFAVEYTIEMGMATDEIVELAAKLNPDMIVMGTTGANGIVNKLIGSNAEHVMQRVKQPIILVPQDCMFENIDNVVYLDELKEDDTPVLSQLFDLGDEIGITDIKLLNINTSFTFQAIDETLLNKLHETFGQEKIKLETVLGVDVKDGINNYLQKYSVDLVVMSTHKKTLLQRIFLTSETDKMALHSKIPLLVYHKD